MNAVKLSSQEQLSVTRYLERYAELLVQDIHFQDVGAFDSVIVMPVFDESIESIQRFLSSHGAHITLMIWVFNAPESTLGSASGQRTQQAFHSVLEQIQAHKISNNVHLSMHHDNLKILIVDRCTEHLIPDKQGVGLARKLGLDLALSLSYQQYLATQNWCYWLYSTDADVKLPVTYGLLPPKENTSACIYPFKHIPEPGFERAMSEYEFSLHYYVESLKRAGSPYAFHTIGSLIVVSSVAYAQVRGIPKRSGAEDFYLLNKLAKLGTIESLTAPVIEISGRPSHRVPFGTGPALVKINAQYENHESFRVYHPRIFTLLTYVLSSVIEIEHSSAKGDVLLTRLSAKIADANELENVLQVLIDLGWQKQSVHLKHLKKAEAIHKAFHVWFDGFITLRFIHEMRDRLYPNILLTELPDYLASELN